MERENAVINNRITLRCQFRYAETSDYFDPHAISKVEILDSDQVTVIETITGANIVKDSTGKYHVLTSAVTTSKTIYDKWYFEPSDGADAITKTLSCVVWSTSAGAGGMTTLSAVREFLKLAAAETEDDTLITNIINRVSKEIEVYCDRVFSVTAHTEYSDGDGRSDLLLKQYPVISVTSLHDDTDREYDSESLISSDDYVVDEDRGVLKLDGLVFCPGKKNVKVVYQAGYTTIPYDLEQACIKLAVAEYLGCQSSHAVVGEQEFYKPAYLRKEAYKVIDRYRRLV